MKILLGEVSRADGKGCGASMLSLGPTPGVPRTLYFGDFYGGFISRYLFHFQPLFPLWRTDSVF